MTLLAADNAICIITPLKGSKVHGKVTFASKGGKVEITGEISGLTPGLHGFHVHEFGDLSSDDGMSTGAHFNPEGKKHGGPHSDMRHVGDLGNIEVRDTLGRHQPAPGDVAGVTRQFLAEHLPTHR